MTRQNDAAHRSERIVIQQLGSQIVATQASEGAPIQAGDVLFNGTYTADPFVIRQNCVQPTDRDPETQRAKVSVLNATHIRIRGGCGGDTTWERTGPMTLVIDAADLFEFDSANLRLEAQPLLNKLGGMLGTQPVNTRVRVCGYTDDLGTSQHNMQLSTRRARALADWLDNHRTPALHIQAEGYGEQYPRYPNMTEKGRARNRRIEIEIEPRTPPTAAQ